MSTSSIDLVSVEVDLAVLQQEGTNKMQKIKEIRMMNRKFGLKFSKLGTGPFFS